MTLNFKKHEDKLTKIGHNFAVTHSGEVIKCHDNNCEENCIFLDGDGHCCDLDRLQWLFSPVYTVKQFTGIDISLLYIIGEGDIYVNTTPEGREVKFIPECGGYDIDLQIFNCEFKPLADGVYKVTQLCEDIQGLKR